MYDLCLKIAISSLSYFVAPYSEFHHALQSPHPEAAAQLRNWPVLTAGSCRLHDDHIGILLLKLARNTSKKECLIDLEPRPWTMDIIVCY